MKVSLRPLTPLWTGDNEGISGELRVTGLMGSLRWWFEALVRANGHYACDPTTSPCRYEPGKQICAACWLFGATGWSRRFRLCADGLGPEQWYVTVNPQVQQMHEGWLKRLYHPNSKVLWGNALELDIRPYSHAETVEPLLRALLVLMSRHGALGAKTQNGLGAFDFDAPADQYRGAIRKFFGCPPKGVLSGNGKRNKPRWFDLSHTIFLDFLVPDSGVYGTRQAVRYPADAHTAYDGYVLPIAYDIRFKSQGRHFRTGEGEDVGLRPLLKGFLRGRARDPEDVVGSAARSRERTASRVFVTHLYRRNPQEPYQFRIWVHLPPDQDVEQAAVRDQIRSFVTTRMFRGSHATVHSWADIQEAL